MGSLLSPKLLLFIATLISSTHSSDPTECRNFTGRMNVESIDLKSVSGVWFPVFTSSEPELRDCATMELFNDQTPDAFTYTISLESGEKMTSKHKIDRQLKYIESDSPDKQVSILSVEKNKLITYTCKINNEDNDKFYREYFTIYFRSLNNLNQSCSNSTDNDVSKLAGDNIDLFPIKQQECKRATQISFEDSELQPINISQRFGIWDLRLYSSASQPFEYIVSYMEGDCQKNYEFNCSTMVNEYITYGTGSRLQKKLNEEQFVETSVLHAEDNYLVIYDFCPSSRTEILKLLERRSSNRTIINPNKYYSIIRRLPSSALTKLNHLVKELKPKSPEPIDATPKIELVQLDEDEVLPMDFEKMSGVSHLKLSTYPMNFDHVVQYETRDGLMLLNFNRSTLIRNSTLMHIPNSNWLNQKVSGTDLVPRLALLYCDDRYYVMYGLCGFRKHETLLLFELVNDGGPTIKPIEFYVSILETIPNKTLTKLKRLMSTLVTVF